MPIITYIGVVFSFMGSGSLDCHRFLLFDDFERNTNIFVAIQSGSGVFVRMGLDYIDWVLVVAEHSQTFSD